MRPIITTKKHYVQISRSTVASGTANLEVLVDAKPVSSVAGTDEVEEGAVVKAIFVELWLIADFDDQSFIITISKQPDATFPTFADLTALGNWSNKKNVLYTSMGLIASDSAGPAIPILRQWIKIPKTKQRFGLGDRLHLSIVSQGSQGIFYCGFATYKEQT